MEVLTLYVGQGNFAIARHGKQAIALDTRWLAERDDDIDSKVRRFLARRELVGIVLTGLDDDHADAGGLNRLLESYAPAWIMYPKYFKDTENAKLIFNVIRKHERRRSNTANPLKRVSVRLDRLESRYLDNLTDEFELELFSPHIEDMDNSNNCSIVLKVEGIGPGGFAYLVTGDTENARWDRIVELFNEALGADVLAAPASRVQERCPSRDGSGRDAEHRADQRRRRQPIRAPGWESGSNVLTRRRPRLPDEPARWCLVASRGKWGASIRHNAWLRRHGPTQRI